MLSYMKHLACGVKSGWQIARGFSMLKRFQMPIVTIFGGSLVPKTAWDYQQAYELAKSVASESCAVITGGGPGIMYAANCGAKDGNPHKHRGNTLGIAVKGVDEDFENECSPLLWVDSFVVRKWLLFACARFVVVFPGGIGTLDELCELLNYMKHKQIIMSPIILVGKDYWKPFVDWFMESGIKGGYIRPAYKDFFCLVDNASEAYEVLKKTLR